ncbi:MAG: aminotransferase class I/II-fold pyridoxal phosphate-dependent enzyme [Algibacter sp.]|uniref:aminotransferase class I/II-fold pyridoxal phosphate-dependent enzyme n=1 Tax=Algibacter sp. TaxID=1872428 RepID=UPI003299682F
MIVENFPDRTVIVDGKEYLYFGGTAYLGLPTNPSFQQALVNGIAKWGSFYGSSRQSNIKLSVFEKAETLFAKQIGSEKTLTTSSGTLAGKLVLESLSRSKSTFYHYPKTHPAVLHAESMPLFENGKLHEDLINNTEEHIVITVDAVLALDVAPTSFQFLNHISSSKHITLVIDESHSIGVLGTNGEGIFKSISNKNIKRKVLVASLGKALGLSGGVIAADIDFIETIKKEALFVSSSCASPGYLECYLESQDIIKNQQRKLKANLSFLLEDLKASTALKFNINYPVIYFEGESVYDYFLNQGIIITNFKYPNYTGLMSRIVINANHTIADLTELKQVLKGL